MAGSRVITVGGEASSSSGGLQAALISMISTKPNKVHFFIDTLPHLRV
jgi:hypothetical protein